MRNFLARAVGIACAYLALAVTLPVHAQDTQDYQGEVEAVWKAQSVVFEFRSTTKLYACDVLAAKVRMILLRLGARDGLQLRSTCNESSGRAKFEVVMESPVAATDENIRALTTYSSEEELIARVRGDQLPNAEEMPRFRASWEPVSFRRDRKLHLDAGDCALVQQLRYQILPKMSVQVTKDMDRVDCVMQQQSIVPPRLMVLALVPVGKM